MLVRRQVKGFLNNLLPNKDQKVKKIEEINVSDYKVLVLPGVKAMEKVRQNKLIIDFISKFNQEKIIACICRPNF